MLIVKMMSGENAPDDDTRKAFRLITGVVDVRFDRQADDPNADTSPVPVMYVWYGDRQERPDAFCVAGNVYIMNESGRTVASFGPMPLNPVPQTLTDYKDDGPKQRLAPL